MSNESESKCVEWMNPTETCNHLKISKDTLYRWVRNDKIPHHRVGEKLIRFDKRELDKWILGQEAP
ncbi:MAG: helix-turn-helix domain-containing protein [Bacteriovoracaceae bacterium]